MARYRELSDTQAANIAEAALSRRFSHQVGLSAVQRISEEGRRNLILRAIAKVDGEPRAIMIKADRALDYDASAPDAFEKFGLVKEWVTRELIGELEPGEKNSARLLAGDAESGLLVFADLGADADSMVTPLLEGTAEEAEAALTTYARSLARLHRRTLGSAARHTEILRVRFPNARVPSPMGTEWLTREIPELLAGTKLPEVELAIVRSKLIDPGPWLGLVHGDGCPDNVLLSEGNAWLIDYEFSAPGHVLLDAVYWRIGFPTCWCAGSVPENVADRIEKVYRRELADVLPEAADDRAFSYEMAIATIARLLNSLHSLKRALEKDETWGIATMRSRILWYLQATIAACDRAGYFRKISQAAQTCLDTLTSQ